MPHVHAHLRILRGASNKFLPYIPCLSLSLCLCLCIFITNRSRYRSRLCNLLWPRMMNVVTLWMLCSTLLASLVWSPSPSLQHLRKDADGDDGNMDLDVVVRQGHRIIVYEFRQEHHQVVKDLGGSAGAGSVDSVRQAANHLADSVTSLFHHAGKGEKPANGKAKETGSSAADKAGEAMHCAKDTIEETMDCAQSKTMETMHAAKGKAEESLRRTKDMVQGAMHAANDSTHETMHSAKDKAVETIHSAKDKVQESLHSSKDMVRGAMHSAKDKTDQTMRAVKDKAEESLYSAKGKAVEAASSAKGKVEEAMQAAKSKALDLLGLEHKTQVCVTEPACRDEPGIHGSSEERAAKERISAAIAAEWLRRCKMKRQEQKRRLWVQVPSLRTVARAVHVLAVATAHGAAVWVTLAQGQVLAKALQRHAFAVVQSRLYLLYFRGLACTVAIALAGLCALQPPLRCLPPLLLSLLSAFLNMFYLEPAATKVIMERLRLEKEEGRGMEENAAAAADGSSLDEEVKKKISVVAKQGSVIHGYSWLCNLVSMAALTWHLVYLSCNMHL